jgi:hypothetical protein
LLATRWDKTITALVASCHSFVDGIKGLAKTRNAKTQSLQTGYPDISPVDRYFSGSMQLRVAAQRLATDARRNVADRGEGEVTVL